jgi:hypothetical protein
LRRCLPVPAETVLTDWLLVLRALSLGATLTFDPVPRMIYRQHPANVARVLPPFSASYVLRAADLVADHYRGLLAPGGVPASRRRRLREAWRDARAFREAMRRSPARLDRYVSALNALTPRFVWWWCVANLELEDVWKN